MNYDELLGHMPYAVISNKWQNIVSQPGPSPHQADATNGNTLTATENTCTCINITRIPLIITQISIGKLLDKSYSYISVITIVSGLKPKIPLSLKKHYTT